MRDFLLLILSLVLFSSCSTNKIATSFAGKLFIPGMEEVETEADWNHFQQSSPANLKMLEGMLYINNENENLLFSLLKGYAGSSFGIHETNYFISKWKGDLESQQNELKNSAIMNYTKAIRYGFRYLEQRDIDPKTLRKYINQPDELKKLLDKNFDKNDEKDLESSFFIGQSLFGLINLQRDRTILVAQIPLAKTFVEWTCSKKPDFKYGLCPMFYGAYEASRPVLLGGNPKASLDSFEKGMKDFPDNLLIPVTFLEYYVFPRRDKDLFSTQQSKIESMIEKIEKENTDPYRQKEITPQTRLYNAIAIKKWNILKDKI